MGLLVTDTGDIVEAVPFGKVPPMLSNNLSPLTDIDIVWETLKIQNKPYRMVYDSNGIAVYFKFRTRWYKIKRQELQGLREFKDFIDGRGLSFLDKAGIGRIIK